MLKDIEIRLHKLAEVDQSSRLFVMRSPVTPKGWKFDHIGFVLRGGDLKDMSGHRYNGNKPEPPVRYSWSSTEDLFKMPGSKQEAVKAGLYLETDLPKSVEVPDEVVCRKGVCAVNCGSFVKIVLLNNGISVPSSNRPYDIFRFLEGS